MTAPSAFDPDQETPAADEDVQSADQVAMALTAPDEDDTADAGPTTQTGGDTA